MKTKKTLFASVALVTLLLCSFSVHGQINDSMYSIKNRWTVKASISRYRTAFNNGACFMHVGDFFDILQHRMLANFKVEANYGINKFIEVGCFTGFQHYECLQILENEIDEETGVVIGIGGFKESFAPLFGVTLNFHILPFFVKSQKCYWDLYLTAKYGGCYLPYKEYEAPDFDYPYSKYRHEYGLGLGISYYIKNIMGFFIEGSVGQFALFKSHFEMSLSNGQFLKTSTSGAESNFSFRVGIAAKINKKQY